MRRLRRLERRTIWVTRQRAVPTRKLDVAETQITCGLLDEIAAPLTLDELPTYGQFLLTKRGRCVLKWRLRHGLTDGLERKLGFKQTGRLRSIEEFG